MRTAWWVAVALSVSGCTVLRVDDLVAEGIRNEVAAIHSARGNKVEAVGPVVEVRLPQATELQMKRPHDKFDLSHRASVELLSEAGASVTCYLAPDSPIPTVAPGAQIRMVGKFYDLQNDGNGKHRVVLVLCHAAR